MLCFYSLQASHDNQHNQIQAQNNNSAIPEVISQKILSTRWTTNLLESELAILLADISDGEPSELGRVEIVSAESVEGTSSLCISLYASSASSKFQLVPTQKTIY